MLHKDLMSTINALSRDRLLHELFWLTRSTDLRMFDLKSFCNATAHVVRAEYIIPLNVISGLSYSVVKYIWDIHQQRFKVRRAVYQALYGLLGSTGRN